MAVAGNIVANLTTNSRSWSAGLKGARGELRTFTSTVTDGLNRAGSSVKTFLSTAEKVESGLGGISTKATNTQFNLRAIARTMLSIQTASRGLSVVSSRLTVLSTLTGSAAAGVGTLATGAGMLSTVAFYAASGLSMLLKPLHGLVIVPKLVAGSFRLMAAAVLAPFKLLWSVVSATAKAAWALARPFVSLAKTAFKLKVFFASLSIQLAIAKKLFALMPPKVRLLVGGLVALGVAGRVGSLAIRGVAAAATMATIAVMAFRNPLKAAGMAALATGRQVLRLARSFGQATRAIARFAVTKTIAGMKGLAGAVGSVASKMSGRLVSGARGVLGLLATIGIAGVGWGAKLAGDAEQAQIGFSTMLKSASAAKTVLGELEQFAASTPFQLTSLRDGAKQLLNAQVATGDLTGQLRILGDIAAGTGKPIGDFVRIYAKARSTGKVTMETLNQLAERGVPIYSALTDQLGGTREEMLAMLGQGKIGFNQLDAALKGTATGAGVFAGGMAAQSESANGLMSTIKDNASFAFREVSEQLMKAFDFKGALKGGIAFFQRMRAGVAAAQPAFMAFAETVKAGFSALWEVGSVALSSIGSLMGVTGGNMMTSFLTLMGVATFVFKEWPSIAELAFKQMQLFAVAGFGTVTHFFTGVLPALFVWFSSNWKSVFFTAFDLVSTVFINIGKNVRSIMSSVWEFIKSGGTKSLSLAWTPLLDGFKNTISQLPDIPKRAIGSLEKQLQQDVNGLGKRIGSGLANEIAGNLKMLEDFKKKADEPAATLTNSVLATAKETAEANTAAAGDGSGSGSDNQSENGALAAGSVEAINAIISSRREQAGNKEDQIATNTAATAAATQSVVGAVDALGAVISGQGLNVIPSFR